MQAGEGGCRDAVEHDPFSRGHSFLSRAPSRLRCQAPRLSPEFTCAYCDAAFSVSERAPPSARALKPFRSRIAGRRASRWFAITRERCQIKGRDPAARFSADWLRRRGRAFCGKAGACDEARLRGLVVRPCAIASKSHAS
uniref:Uncharacterized protein n=1 Tax=Methylocapsa acidiphila TaxID=133552 RepID=Q2VNP2_METAI|nr:hypothetical protein orf14 [Methylocapsa acidiphila]